MGGNEDGKGELINGINYDKEHVTITLDLNRSLFLSDFVTETRHNISILVKALAKNISWKTMIICLITEILLDCVWKKQISRFCVKSMMVTHLFEIFVTRKSFEFRKCTLSTVPGVDLPALSFPY